VLKWQIEYGIAKPDASTSGGGEGTSLLAQMRAMRTKLHKPVKSRNAFAMQIQRVIPPELDEITSVALCDLLGLRPAPGNFTKIARAMVTLGWIPWMRKHFAGHWRGTALRGYTRIAPRGKH
jgi:hypothetical protein